MKSLQRSLFWLIAGLPLASGLGLGCDAIFGRYLEPNPPSCGSGCPAGQTCNAATQTCEESGDMGADLGDSPDMPGTPPSGLTLVAGALGGKGNADDSTINARFDNPEGIASDGSSTLYIADTGNHCIRKFNTVSGSISTLAGSCGEPGLAVPSAGGTTARFDQPAGITYDGNGNLFIADRGNSVIRKLVITNQVVTTHSGNGTAGFVNAAAAAAQFNKPSGIAISAIGLLVADTENHAIRKVTLADGTASTFAGDTKASGTTDGGLLVAQFNRPVGIAVAPGGLTYVSDSGSHLIRRLDSMNVTTILGINDGGGYVEGGPGVAKFRSPAGLFALDANSLLLADSGNHVIRRINNAPGTASTDTIVGMAGNPGPEDGAFSSARINTPMGITGVAGGVLFVADKLNHAIRTLDLNSRVVKPGAGLAPQPGSMDGPGSTARFREPRGLATDGQGNIFVADETNYTIRKINQATGAVSTIAGIAGQPGNSNSIGGAPTFHRPVDVAADGMGNLYISDSLNHVIRKLDLATGSVSTLAGQMSTAGNGDGQGTAASFWNPAGLAYDGQGSLFVADTMNQTLRQIVLATGQVTTVAGFAGSPAVTDGIGSAARFNNPMGVACDRQGNVYVSDNSGHVIRKVVVATRDVSTFAGSGFVGLVNLPGLAAKFDGPQGLSIDPAGFLYVADSGNRAIRKIQLRDAIVSTFVGQSRRSGIKLGPLPARVNFPRAVLWLGGAGGLVFSDAFEHSILRAL